MNIITDIPTILNNVLFDGDATYLGLSKVVLVAMILFGTMLPLLYLKATVHQIMFVELLIIGLLTGIGWMDASVLVVLALILAVMFGKPIADQITGKGG